MWVCMQVGRRYNILIFQVKSVTLKSLSAVRVDVYFSSVIIWSEMKSSIFTFSVKKKKWWRFLLKEKFFCPLSFGLISTFLSSFVFWWSQNVLKCIGLNDIGHCHLSVHILTWQVNISCRLTNTTPSYWLKDECY